MNPQMTPFGRGFVHITSEEFLNGYQAGHLAYRIARNLYPSDRHMTSLLMERLECPEQTELYNFGYVVGWLATIANTEAQEEQA